MARSKTNPDQLPLVFGRDSEIERIIDARVAIRAEAEAIRWRFRLIVIETAMLAAAVFVAGWLIGQPVARIFWSALMVAAGCLLSGLLLVGLSGGLSMLLSRIRRCKTDRDAIARWTRRS